MALPKTIYFNLRHLPFRQAVRIPVIVSHRVNFISTKGLIHLNSNNVRPGIIRICFGDVGIFDARLSRSIWKVDGRVNFKGNCSIGHGSKISVSSDGTLDIGENFIITAESSIVCRKHISIGDNCIFSWDVLMIDTDFHKVLDGDGNILNNDKEIVIGDNIWIGCRCLILKGVTINTGNIIAANTTITRSLNGNNQIIGGNPLKVLKMDVYWDY